MDDPSVMPVAGIFEFAPEKGILVAYEGIFLIRYCTCMSSSLDFFNFINAVDPVYQSEDRKFTFVQQRTPILKVSTVRESLNGATAL